MLSCTSRLLPRFALPVAAALALAGCESMSVSECKVVDWYRVGLTDGAQGESDRRIANYTEDCAKAGITPNAPLYRQGWNVGIVQFCTAANGWRAGIQGHSGKSSLCLGQAGYPAFSRYFEAGLQVHRTQELMRRNNDEANRLQARLDASKSDDERKSLREDLRRIDREQARLRNQLAQQQMLGP